MVPYPHWKSTKTKLKRRFFIILFLLGRYGAKAKGLSQTMISLGICKCNAAFILMKFSAAPEILSEKKSNSFKMWKIVKDTIFCWKVGGDFWWHELYFNTNQQLNCQLHVYYNYFFFSLPCIIFLSFPLKTILLLYSTI